MDNGKFILCRNCGEVHHVTAFDKTPSYSHVAGETKERPSDDWRTFMNQHAGHGLEALKALGECYFPNGMVADPMAVAYLKVTNGHQSFLLRRYRRSIDEPLRFERIEGSLGEPVIAIEIQEREIRKELKLRFRSAPGQVLSDAKIDLFVALFRAAADQFDGKSAAAVEPSYANENVSYAPLLDAVKDSLLQNCARHFTRAELEALRSFVEAHNRGSDVMTLVLRRRVPLEERV